MNPLLKDFRYALRGFLKNPGFAVVAVLSLGLGIGANTAIFSLMDRVLLRSLPVRNPQELVVLTANDPRNGSVLTNYDSDYTFSYPMYRDFRDGNPVFSGVVAWFEVSANLSLKGQTEVVNSVLVSGNFFDVLGVRTILGRSFTADDDRAPGASPFVVLSHAFWVRRFGADPGVLNQSINLNGHPMTIVGVAAPGFQGLMVGDSAALYVPVMMESQMMPGRSELEKRRSAWLNLFARLKPGITRQSAESAMNAFWRPILEQELKEMPQVTETLRKRFLARHITLLDARNGISALRDMFGTPLILLMTLVGLVLLIACANVANLLIARAAGRRREIAIRLALGAGRRDIIRQILAESAVLSLAGGALGLLLASWTTGLLLRLLPFDRFAGITDAISTDPDVRILGFTAAISIASGIIFGLMPALQAARPNVASTLQQQAANVLGGTGLVRSRKALVVVQVTLSLLLLVGAGLFMRSLQNLKSINPGFRTDHLISFSVDPSLNGYDHARAVALYDRLLDRIGGLPGVRSASLDNTPLLTGQSWYSGIEVPGRERKETDHTPHVDSVSPGYFASLGTPLLGGREFTTADGSTSPKVAIVNEAFVQMYFENRNPLGQHFYFTANKKEPVEIVAIVKNGKYGDLREKNQEFLWCPYPQRTGSGSMTFYVRTSQEPETIASALRQAVHETDSNLPVTDMKTMEQQIDDSVFTERIISGLSAFFGLLATLLAAIGLYGVMSYTVTQRTREIGIRMALGADRNSVLKLVLSEVAVLIGIGIAIALPASYPLAKLTQSLLFGVATHDPSVLAGATCLLALVALLAGYIPAQRASRVDPLTALRQD
jgi:predicted permease